MNTDFASPTLVSDLRALVRGRLITPGDDGYDKARTLFYGGFDRRPAAIVRVADEHDVAQVVTFARERGLELAVRSGGHSIAGYSVSEGGIVLDLSEMRALEIDRAARTAWVQTGMTAGEFTKTVGEHGLAVGFGDTGSVGIGGITLGGGVGFLSRKYGLTIDSLLAAEIVTADGQLRYTDAETEPDLFWAIRGGGGNFGVATRFKFQLHEVGTVYGGLLMLPATPDIIAAFVAEAEVAPEELTTIATIMPALPFFGAPEEYMGQLIIMAFIVYAGDLQSGERAVAPFRALATPIVDALRPMPYPEMYPEEEEAGDGYHPVAKSRIMFLDYMDREVAQTMIEHLKRSTGDMSVTQFRVLGGAMARVPVEATAYAHRNSRIMVSLATMYGNPADADTHEAWVSRYEAALRQSDTGAYVNFLADVSAEQVRQAYPEQTWERLAAIKAHYDPTNFFRLNQNIPPAA